MRVLVDCTQVTKAKAGVGVYALNLTTELIRRQNSHGFRMWLLVQDDDPDFAFDHEDVTVLRVPGKLFRIFPLRLLMEQLYIPWLTRKYKIDVLHSLHYSFPLLKIRARKLVTIHDMTSVIMPHVHLAIKVFYFRFFIHAASYLADTLIFDSQSTLDDYKRYFPRVKKPFYVAHLGKAPIFRPGLDRQKVQQTLQKYQLREPYILYIGTIEPRKNLVRLVEAFHRIAQLCPDHNLVIAGMKGWMYDDLFEAVQRLKLESRVAFAGFIAEEDKPYVISAAAVFAYPSLYEGFGIPVLESLACGTPTLAGNRSSLPEVAGDAALLVNPENVDDIADNLHRLLTDFALRDSLRSKSIQQAARFSWCRTAEETLQAYFQSPQPTAV